METSGKIVPSEISAEMICSIANLAVLGVDGIEKTYMNLKDAVIDVMHPSAVSKGVRVVEKDNGYRIDLFVITEKNVIIPTVCRNAQIKVKESVEIMTGKPVAKVNLHVEGSGKY
ncbi:MAG: Asp23/Gls24 family envelope stress response protein [Bacilli bacterium]|jgi:uncharacterized alkaline shock family protein YloU